VQRKIQPCDIEPGEIHTIVNTVVIGIVPKERVVPRLEFTTKHEIQFQVEMRTLPV
jgi:hypothetical protein